MTSRLLLVTVLSLICFACTNSAAKGHKVSIKLSFDADPKCLLDGKKPSEDNLKVKKTYDDDTISWASSCSLTLPKKVSHCVMTGQSVYNPDAISQWSAKADGGNIEASMVSEADINPNYGKLEAHYFCH